LFRWFIAIAGMTPAFWAIGHYSKHYILPFAHWVRALGAWGPTAFIVAYILADILFVPASALTLVAGALFGFVTGSIYTFIGAMLGSVAAFFMGRYVVRPLVASRLRGDRRFELIDSAATRGGIKRGAGCARGSDRAACNGW